MLFRWLISTIGLAALKGEITAAASRAARRAMLVTLIVLFWLIAFGFALAALTIWLAGMWGGLVATAIIAAGFAVIGLAIQVGLVLSSRKPARPVTPLADVATPIAAGIAAQPGGFFGSLAVVAIVGWLLGRQVGRK